MHCFAHGVTWSANKAQYTAVAAYRYKEVRLVKCNSVLINQVQHTIYSRILFHSQIKLKQNKIKLNLFLYFFIVFSFIRIIRLFPIVLLEIFASSVLKLLSHINAAALGPNEPSSPQKKATR